LFLWETRDIHDETAKANANWRALPKDKRAYYNAKARVLSGRDRYERPSSATNNASSSSSATNNVALPSSATTTQVPPGMRRLTPRQTFISEAMKVHKKTLAEASQMWSTMTPDERAVYDDIEIFKPVKPKRQRKRKLKKPPVNPQARRKKKPGNEIVSRDGISLTHISPPQPFVMPPLSVMSPAEMEAYVQRFLQWSNGQANDLKEELETVKRRQEAQDKRQRALEKREEAQKKQQEELEKQQRLFRIDQENIETEKMCNICMLDESEAGPLNYGFQCSPNTHVGSCLGCTTQVVFGEDPRCPFCREPVTTVYESIDRRM